MPPVSSPLDAAQPVLVVGCGALGASLAAPLIALGHPVTVLTRDSLTADAIHARGLRARGTHVQGAFRADAATTLRKRTRHGLVLLAAHPEDAGAAMETVVPHLSEDAVVVSLAPGLCEPRLARAAGAGRIIGALATWGASRVEPATVERFTTGDLILGLPGDLDHPGWLTDADEATDRAGKQGTADENPDELDSTAASNASLRFEDVACLLEAVAPVTTTHNLLGARWAQLVLESTTTMLGLLGGQPLARLLEQPPVGQLAVGLVAEAVAVAEAADVRLETLPGTIDLVRLAESNAEPSSESTYLQARLRAVASRYGYLQPSGLAEETGRPERPSLGASEHVARRGEALGVDTPLHANALRAATNLCTGKQRAGVATLCRLLSTSAPPRAEVTPRHEVEGEVEDEVEGEVEAERDSEVETESEVERDSEVER